MPTPFIYVHQVAKDNTVWFDDVTVSTGYIGPAAGKPGVGSRQ